MTQSNRASILISVLAAAALCAGSALAAAGGGSAGGSGGAPSMSGPAYDPVQEYQNGLTALKAEKWKDAGRAFNRVLEVTPKDANTWALLGLAKAGGGDLKGAVKAYEKAVRYDADNLVAHRELGLAQARLGRADKAQAELDWVKAKSAACAGDCAQAIDLKAAEAALEAALAPAAPLAPATPTPEAPAAPTPSASLLFQGPAGGDRAYVAAVALINAGRYEDALASLRDSQALLGPHPDILTYMGFASRKLRRFDQAEVYYRAALAVDPGHRGATEYWGEMKVEQGDLKGAEAMLARLDDLCGFGCAEAEELRGWIDQARSRGR
jgi:tetratricopeptide (TPR) repeat protein